MRAPRRNLLSLTTRVSLWLAGLWLPVLGCVLGFEAWALLDTQRTLWTERNQASAALIAAELAGLSDDGDARRKAATARFDRGGLLTLVVYEAGSPPVFEQRPAAGAKAAGVPGWFSAFVIGNLEPATAAAPAAKGEARTLQVEVITDGADLQRLAWGALWHTAVSLLTVSTIVAVLAAWVLVRWRRSLKATLAQAHALERLQFVEAPEGRWPELRDLTRAMNAVVRRLREQVAAQAEQVVQLQRQAQTDGVTGLPSRAFFVPRLADLLSDARAPAASLLMVRVPELGALNERHGREAADRLLAAVADVLQTYAERVPGAVAGRVAGPDFALGLPAAGAARETAAAIQAAIAAAPAARLPGVRIVIAGCDGLQGMAAGAALAAADAALERAEATGECVVEETPDRGAPGVRAWRGLVAAALDESRVRLGAFAVIDARGGLIHLECPLRVQLEPGGEYLVARRWLAIAARNRLLPLVDMAALDLALLAIGADGQPRCVHVAPRSLLSPGFARALLARLKSAGAAAASLSIEWPELSEGSTPAAALREAVPAWRKLGVRVGVEHAGGSPRGLPALKEFGVDYVKVDSRHLIGVADDDAARNHVEGLVALIRGLGLQAIAEGVAEEKQLGLLWTVGFDGATGPGVKFGGGRIPMTAATLDDLPATSG